MSSSKNSSRNPSDDEGDREEEPPSVLKEIKPGENPDAVCKLCFRPASGEDDINLGPLFSYGYCQAHLFCLMFSSGLDQNGDDEEGIKGFLTEDIVKEWRRGSQLKCTFCKKKYATVGCVGNGCKKTYHLPCGIENGALQQFFGSFGSFCQTHRPVQAPLAKKPLPGVERPPEECGICLDELDDKPGNDVLWTPCCGGWFHRQCMEKYAMNAGCHFFNCPLCKNSEDFLEEMQQFGIYLPDQDAEWETEEAFGDQYVRHDTCDAEPCLCPEGRKHDIEDTLWEIMLCVCCGHRGIHVECGKLDLDRPRWKCEFCKDVVQKLPNKPISIFTRVKRDKKPVSEEALQERMYARGIFENLTFRVGGETGFDISVDYAKSRKDPPVTRFLLKGTPVRDIPMPVKLMKKDEARDVDKIKNIPCPWEECSQLVSRLDFKNHCQKHRDEEDANDKENKVVKISVDSCNESSVHETDNSGDQEIASKESNPGNTDSFKVKINSILSAASPNNLTGRKREESSEEEPSSKRKKFDSGETRTPKSKLSPSSDSKQSSILSFFSRFKPKEGGSPLSPKLEDIINQSKNSDEEDKIVKKEDKTIIKSNVGFFKINEELESEISDCPLKAAQKSGITNSFICQYCKMTFTNALTWKSHEYSHETKASKCAICAKEFSSEKALEKHRTVHNPSLVEGDKAETPKMMIQCDECDYKCIYNAAMKKHMQSKHSKVCVDVKKKDVEIVEISSSDESEPSVKVKDKKKSTAVALMVKEWEGIQSFF